MPAPVAKGFAALFASISAASITVAVTKLAVDLAITAGLTWVLGQLSGSPSGSGRQLLDPESLNTLSADMQSARTVVYGTEVGVAGEIVFQQVSEDKEWVSYVIQLSDGGQENDDAYPLYNVLLDGEDQEYNPLTGQFGGSFASETFVTYYNGKPSQTADTTLITSTGGVWTSAHRGRGCAYAIWDVHLSNQELFQNGRPDPMFIMGGRCVYDPRADSTAGGSGSQRLNDPSTWAPSRNAALIIADYAMGVKMDTKWILGAKIPMEMIDWDQLAASASACDTHGWEIQGVVASDQDPAVVIKAMAEAMCGRVCISKGKLAIIAGHDWPSVITLTEHDLAGPYKMTASQPWRESANALVGNFRNPDEKWEEVQTAPVTNSAWLALDGESFQSEEDLPYTTDNAMAVKILKNKLYRQRAPRTINAPFKIRAAQAGEGSIVTVNFPSYDIDETYEVVNRSLNPQGFVTLSLRLFEWDELAAWMSDTSGSSLPTFDIIDRPAANPPTPTGWIAETWSQDEEGGGKLPAIKLTGSAIPGLVDLIILEYRLWTPDNSSPWWGWGSADAYTGVAILTGLAPNTFYDISIKYRRRGFVSPNAQIIPKVKSGAQIVSNNTMYVGDVFSEELIHEHDRIKELVQSLNVRIDETRAFLGDLGFIDGVPLGATLQTITDLAVNGSEVIATTISLLGAKSEDGTAFILDLDTVKVSPTETLGYRLDALSVSIDNNGDDIADVAAAVITEQSARITADGALASDISTVSTTVDGHTASITSINTAISGQQARAALLLDVNGFVTGWEITNTGTNSEITFLCTKFKIVDATGGNKVTVFSYSGSVIRMASVEVDTIKANTVITTHLQADAVNKGASNAVSGLITVGNGTNYSSGFSGTTIASFSMTTAGGRVALWANCRIWGTDTWPAGSPTDLSRILLRLYRDATLLAEVEAVNQQREIGIPAGDPTTWVETNKNWQNIAFNAVDSPAAGTYTYSLQACNMGSGWNNGGYTKGQAMQRTLIGNEFKR